MRDTSSSHHHPTGHYPTPINIATAAPHRIVLERLISFLTEALIRRESHTTVPEAPANATNAMSRWSLGISNLWSPKKQGADAAPPTSPLAEHHPNRIQKSRDRRGKTYTRKGKAQGQRLSEKFASTSVLEEVRLAPLGRINDRSDG